MIIDVFVQVGKSINDYELTPEELTANMDKYGIDYSVISPVQPLQYRLEPENDYIAELAKGNDRFIGFCRIDPRQKEKAIEELHRSVQQLGLKGVFLNPWEEGYQVNADFVVPVVQAAGKLGVPVLIATGYPWVSHALQVADLASKAPESAIIMTHGGQLNISGFAIADAYLAMSLHENLFMEISGVYRQDHIANVIETISPERVLFGSNSPQMHQGFELDRALNATRKNEKHRELLLGGNIKRLLNLQEEIL